MNIQEFDILNALMAAPFQSQRELALRSGYSLGLVNRSVKELIGQDYLDRDIRPTAKARAHFEATAPKNAVILAAGFGMRMVPLNTVISKGLLEVRGEVLIERIIRQLQEAGIRDISIVVGFLKEQYEYLIDTYGVRLIVNREYSEKNNLHSMKLALSRLGNTYVVPCDLWCRDNPFRRYEPYSWYMVSSHTDPDSTVRVNRKKELVLSSGGNAMVGIAYLTEDALPQIRRQLESLAQNRRFDSAYWEEALALKDKLILPPRIVEEGAVVEINTYEQLRELDSNSNQLQSEALTCIARALKVSLAEITNITVLKKGMTNRSFCFTCRDKKYIMRIPGEGTGQLIDRNQEYAVYTQLRGRGLCDDICYIDPHNGYKITEFLENARTCDPGDPTDLERCMKLLRTFHECRLQVKHSFDIFEKIEFYQSLWGNQGSIYRDYTKTKAQVLSLKTYIDAQAKDWTLTHIDAVPDNFLFAGEDLRLIDWEYAGMQDPHVDIAMFCIYALYERPQVEQLIDLYFPEGCPRETRIKIYCYIAACGLLWSNWCEYKRSLGVDFGEYSLRQYRYAKEYYKIVKQELEGTL